VRSSTAILDRIIQALVKYRQAYLLMRVIRLVLGRHFAIRQSLDGSVFPLVDPALYPCRSLLVGNNNGLPIRLNTTCLSDLSLLKARPEFHVNSENKVTIILRISR
jgi:hypothetical protein